MFWGLDDCTPGLGIPGLGTSVWVLLVCVSLIWAPLDPQSGTLSLGNLLIDTPVLSTPCLGTLGAKTYEYLVSLILIKTQVRCPKIGLTINYSLLGARLSNLSSRSKIHTIESRRNC